MKEEEKKNIIKNLIEGIYFLIKGSKIKSAEKRKRSEYRQQAIQF